MVASTTSPWWRFVLIVDGYDRSAQSYLRVALVEASGQTDDDESVASLSIRLDGIVLACLADHVAGIKGEVTLLDDHHAGLEL